MTNYIRPVLLALFAVALCAQRPPAGGQITGVSGVGSISVTSKGAQTPGRCVQIDADGDHVATGGACGGSGASIPATSAILKGDGVGGALAAPITDDGTTVSVTGRNFAVGTMVLDGGTALADGCALTYSAATGRFSCPGAFSYYVDSWTGLDSNPGTLAQPWQTIARVNATVLTPGQSVGFKKGGLWREMLTPGQSGTAGRPISFGAYGDGAQPTIDAANLAVWTQGAGALAQETCTGPCLFDSGMETGGATFTDWTSQTVSMGVTITQSTLRVPHGLYSAAITGTGSATGDVGYLVKTIAAPVAGTMKYFRFYVYIPTGALQPNLSNEIILASPAYGSFNLALSTNGTGNVTTMQLYANGCAPCSTAVSFAMDAWHIIDVAYLVGTTTSNGGGQLWLDGSSIGSNFTINSTGGIAMTNVALGPNNYGQGLISGGVMYFDDFRIAGAPGPIGAFSGGVPTTVWSTPVASDPLLVLFGNSPSTKVAGVGSLTGPNQYAYSAPSLYVYSAANPTPTVEIPTRNYSVNIDGKSYLTFNGISTRGAFGPGGFAAQNGSNFITVSNSTIELNVQSGIWFYDVAHRQDNGVLTNNDVRYNGASGMEIAGDQHSNWAIMGNRAYGNSLLTTCGICTFSAGIKMFSDSATGGAGTIISGNISHDNGIALNTQTGVGIWSDSCVGVTITKNVTYGNKGNGIFQEKNINGIVTYNLSYGDAASQYAAGLAVYTSGEVPIANLSSGNLIANNTASGGYWACKFGAYTGYGAAFFSNNTVKNNTCVGSSGTQAYFDSGADNNGTNGSGNTYSRNAFGPATTGFVHWGATGNLNTYTALDTSYGSSMGNVQTDPLFTNPVAFDFTLQPGSPALGAGVFIPGVSTANPPNIGAK